MKKILAYLLAAILSISPALATTTPNSVVTCQTPNRGIVQFLQGSDVALTYKTAYTASANGSKILGIVTNNNDASQTHVLTCQIVNGGVKYGGVVLLSIVNAGFTSGTPAQSLMTSALWPGLPLDSDGNPYQYLASGDTLQCTFATAITSTDLINVVVEACDF